MINFKIDNIFKPLYTSKKRYFFLTGGRGSTKTFSVHDYVVKLTYESGHGILFTRYTMKSAEKSIIPEFKMTLERLGILSDFKITQTTAVNLKTGSFIFFSGIKTAQGDQTANLKSLPNITTWIIEEGEDFNDEKAFDTIDDSIRQKGVHNRVIWIQNPSTVEHFIYNRWIADWNKQIDIDGFKVSIGCHPEVENIHSTYLIATNYLSKSFLKKAWGWRFRAKTGLNHLTKDTLSSEDHDKAKKWYLGNYLGGWRDKAEGVIYSDWVEGSFNDGLPYCYGLDFGYADPDALVKVAVDQNKMLLYVQEKYFKNATGTNALTGILLDRVGRTDLIIGDCAEKRLISDLWEAGLNIRRSLDKSPKRDIKKIQGFTIVVTPESLNIKKALNNYKWSDRQSEMPHHDFSDLMDSMRYGFSELMRS